MGAHRPKSNEPIVRIATTARLAAAGYGPAAIRARVRKGELVKVAKGYYTSSLIASQARSCLVDADLLAVAVAITRRGSAAVASHDTAALLHGLDLLDRPGSRVTVTVAPGTGSREAASSVRIKIAAVPARQMTVRYGLRVTSVARTVVDIARSSPVRAGVVTADSALRMKLTTKDELRAVLATCRRWPGVTRAADVVEFADRLSESALESITRVAFRDLGLPPPQLQARVGNEYDELARADFLWPQFSTIAEADGALKYADPDRARQQLWRDARLREAGFEVVHISWREITRYPENVAASIRAAFERGLALRNSPSRR
jgi:predicted transcriptional regulator of viral defense system